MKRINGFLLSLFMLISFSSGIVFAQLREIKLPQSSSSSAKFYQNEDKIYTTSISVKFKEKVVDGPKGLRKYAADQIDKKYVSLPNELNKLKKKFGDFELIKMIPDAEWGNNVRKNKRTGETVVLKDMSQWYRINFNSPFPVDSVLKIFRSFPYIEYACEIPIIQSEATTPNDAYFTNPGQWNLNVINATQAWDKTKGSSSIKIGIVDQAHYTTHEDLAGKIVLRRNGTGTHGIQVAGVAGAVTNNSTGIASLGWNTTINAYFYGSTTSNDDIADIITLAAQECDIINMSWKSVTTETIVCSSKTYTLQKPIDFPIIVDAVYNALQQGVICVAAAGNERLNINLINPPPDDCNICPFPYQAYPAFEPGVIAVSATQMYNSAEIFRSGYNYGGYIDVAAPGGNILTTDGTNNYIPVNGTSYSTPLVSALASLILAINPTLSVADVTKVLINSTDKIDATAHPYDANGRNSYLGYGRINAKKAVDNVPSAPGNLYITGDGSTVNRVKLNWIPSVGLNISTYEVYRSDVTNHPYEIIPGNVSFFVDPEARYRPTTGATTLTYKIRAKNSLNIYSAFSNTATTKADMFKDGNNEDETTSGDFIPVQYGVAQNYPNPFNPTTSISFDLPGESYVTLIIYDMLGAEVAVLSNGHMAAGRHTVKFNGSSFASGIYIYKFTASAIENSSNFVKINKMLLLK